MTTLTSADLSALGYRVKDGVAIRVGSGPETELARQQRNAGSTSPAATVSPYHSKTEAAYAGRLYVFQRVGDIRDFRYEAVTLRLGDRVRYTPDFRVVLADGAVELHEVKGAYTREDARIKLQSAATLFPEYRFKLCVYAGGQWTISTVRAA